MINQTVHGFNLFYSTSIGFDSR